MEKYLPKIKLSSDALKLIAMILMTIDHVGRGILYLYLTTRGLELDPNSFTKINKVYDAMNGLGRIAFPIFAFFLVEGFFHTKSKIKYALRLFLFALISEVAFDLALFQSFWAPDHQNTLFSLLLGLITIWAIDYVRKINGLATPLMCVLIVCLTCASMQLSQILLLDYKWHGMLVMVALYLLHDFTPVNLLAGAGVMSYEKFAPIAYFLLYFYDSSQKPNPRLKYVFYLFYPVHLLLIYLIVLGLGL